MEPSKIRVIAYCCMILGSFFLMKSILFKSPKFVLHELLRFKVSKSRFFRRYISQKLEAIIGFVFFAAGCAQLAYVELTKIDQLSWGVVGGVTLLAILFIGFVLHQITRYFSGKIFVEQLRFIVLKHGFSLERDEGLVRELGKILRVKMSEDDTIGSYTERVRAKMKLPESTTQRRGSPRPPGL
ncbi:MAG: hypothetical protein ACYTEG_03070 [Planctomycetota bacterium]|jgi:hypothetical protein